MDEHKKIKLALIKGDGWTEWEGKGWQELEDVLDLTVFINRRMHGAYGTDRLNIKQVGLPCSNENFLIKNYFKYIKGQYKVLFGLEKKLAGFDIAQGLDLYNYYTLQAIRAKKYNPNLKVVVQVFDNMPGRFEHNYWPGFKMPPRYWRQKINGIMAEVVEKADLFLAMTEYSAEMLRFLGVEEKRIKVVPPVIIIPEKIEKKELFDKLGLDTGQELYLAVNRLVKEKGVYELIYGWKMYIQENKSASKVLLIVGNGPEKSNLERLIKEWGMEKQMKIVSNVPNHLVRSLYHYAVCNILCSLPTNVWQEQFGYVLAEAISCNCPVISTWSGAIPEVVGDAGILISPGNYVELKDALNKMDNKELHAQLQANCDKIKYKYSLPHHRKTLLDAYKEIL